MAVTSPRTSSRERRIAPEAFYGDLDQLLKKGDPKPAFQQMIEWVRQIAESHNLLQRDFNASEFELRTKVATTSGTEHDFTNISDLANEIVVMLEGVSTSGTSVPMIRIGDSGGITTSGYLGSRGDVDASPTVANATNGFTIMDAWTATSVMHGHVVLTLIDSTTWIASGVVGRSAGANQVSILGYSKSLSGTLDRVRLTTSGGTDTFDAGAVNILIKKSRS